MRTPEAGRAIEYTPSIGNFLPWLLLSFCAIMLLPRQFSRQRGRELQRRRSEPRALAVSVVPGAINLFVIPIALAGLVTFRSAPFDSDMYVLALPMEGNARYSVSFVFIGGLSAATSRLVIVECVALSIMVSNDIVMPLCCSGARVPRGQKDFADFLLGVRRYAIFAQSWRWRISTIGRWGNAQLVAIGLLSFAAIAQLARRSSADCSGGARPRRRHGGHAGRLCGVSSTPCFCELPGWHYRRFAIAAARAIGIEVAAPASAVRRRSATCFCTACFGRFPLNCLTYIVLSACTRRPSFDRTIAGRRVMCRTC